MRTSNKDARELVETRQDFKGNHTYGETEPNGVYAVYSYGSHFPIYAFQKGSWFHNTDGYSVTTAKHKSQLRPNVQTSTGLDTEGMKRLIATGRAK